MVRADELRKIILKTDNSRKLQTINKSQPKKIIKSKAKMKHLETIREEETN